MKNFTLFLLLLITSAAFSQSKKEIEAAKDFKIDSLTKATQNLTLINDSIGKDLDKYLGLYTTVKEKVFKFDFDPTKISELIDSLKTKRDSVVTFASITASYLRDTVKNLQTENSAIKKENEGLKFAVTLLKGSAGIMPVDAKDFNGTWSLNLRKIAISGDSPHSGFVDVSAVADTVNHALSRLTFLDAEFAELVFDTGSKTKCFFSVNGFSKTEPYYIDLKGTGADIRLYAIHTVNGLQVSYELSALKGTYFYGYMVK